MNQLETTTCSELSPLRALTGTTSIADALHVVCQNGKIDSAVLALLSADGKAHYYQLQKDGFTSAVEAGLERVRRYGNDGLKSGIRQSVLRHIVRGLGIVYYLRSQIPSIAGFSDEQMSDFWRDCELSWMVHDLGEYGLEQDITVDQKGSEDNASEAQVAHELMKQISDLELRERLWKLFMLYEHNTSLEPGSQDWLLYNFIKLIDKLEALTFIHGSGFGKWQRNQAPTKVPAWQKHAIEPILESFESLAEYLDSYSRHQLLVLFQELIDTYDQAGLLTKNLYQQRIDHLLAA